MNSIFNEETLLHVWPFLCLTVILTFGILLFRFLWNNGGKRNLNKKHVIIPLLIAANSMLGGCEKNAPQSNETVNIQKSL
jgi:hypothetical protein